MSSRQRSAETFRVGAVADLHFGRHPPGSFQQLFRQISDEADVLAICGDLTDHGDPDEARGLTKEIAQYLSVPVIAVLGNHDFEAGRVPELARDAARGRHGRARR